MKRLVLSLSAFERIAVTRVALGLGIGLLIADRLGRDRRRTIGVWLVALGAVSTASAAITVRRGLRNAA